MLDDVTVQKGRPFTHLGIQGIYAGTDEIRLQHESFAECRREGRMSGSWGNGVATQLKPFVGNAVWQDLEDDYAITCSAVLSRGPNSGSSAGGASDTPAPVQKKVEQDARLNKPV